LKPIIFRKKQKIKKDKPLFTVKTFRTSSYKDKKLTESEEIRDFLKKG